MSTAAPARLAAAIAVAGLTVLALAGCGRFDEGSTNAADTGQYTDLSWEAQALEAVGFSSEQLAAVAEEPAPTAGPGRDGERRHQRHPRLRFGFGHRVLHGEAVVRTDEGTKTVVVQRGSVTAIDDRSITVKSTDGFTLTWTFADPLRVFERRSQIQPSEVAEGTQVGVVGVKEADTTIARVIVVAAR